jgi:hypothetical protein
MNDNNPVLHQKVEIKVDEKMLPVTDWHMDWTPLDQSTPMPSPKAIADMLDVKVHCEGHGVEPGLSQFLEGIYGNHEAHETDVEGVFEHTFTPYLTNDQVYEILDRLERDYSAKRHLKQHNGGYHHHKTKRPDF